MITTARRQRPPRLPGGARLPRPGPRGLAVGLVVVAILVGAFFWVRQSSLVAVRQVTITGVSGPDAAQIRAALSGAARGMSTLGLDQGRLHAAVAPFPVVRALHLHAEFPHGLRIAVAEQVPVAVLVAGGERTLVAGDGTLLRSAHTTSLLPTVSSPVVPGGSHVTGTSLTEVQLLAAAPYALLARVASAGRSSQDGLIVSLRRGPMIVFGADAELAAKWRAAVAVLASSSSSSASYIDVTDPARPAAGSGTDAPVAATSPSAATSGSATNPTVTTGQTTVTSASTTG